MVKLVYIVRDILDNIYHCEVHDGTSWWMRDFEKDDPRIKDLHLGILSEFYIDNDGN